MEVRLIDTYTGKTYLLEADTGTLILSKQETGAASLPDIYTLIDQSNGEIYALQVSKEKLYLVKSSMNAFTCTLWGVKDIRDENIYILELSAGELSFREATDEEIVKMEQGESSSFMNRKMLDYLPLFIQEYAEIQAIMEAEQVSVIRAWKGLEYVMADQFVRDATENGLKRWEAILALETKGTNTLEERRFNVLARLSESTLFTMETLKAVLATMCGANGYTITLDHEKYLLVVKLSLTNQSNLEAVKLLLKRMVPANMVTVISAFNTHEMLGNYTHAQLAKYTHRKVREENIES